MVVPQRTAVEIKGEQRPICRIFNDEFTFAIPPYQRPYAWEEEHAEALLDDLLAAMGENGEPVNTLNPYFLGTIVLVQRDSSSWDVVDGQQRLITLTILLAALRATVPPDVAKSITDLIYEPESRLLGLPARFRIRPRPQDVSFLEHYVQRADGISKLLQVNAAELSDSQRNMRDNALLYVDRFKQMDVDTCTRLAQFIVQRCLLIVVSTQDIDSAYRIFAVLNDRGLDLSHADILKAEVIGGIPQHHQLEYTGKWERAETDLGREDFEALLAYIRMLFRKKKLQETVLKEFREYVIRPVRDSQRIVDDVILPYAAAYGTIRDEDYQHTHGAEVVNTHLHWLNRIPDSDWIPPAMCYLVRHGHDAHRCGRFFTDLERLAAGLMLRRTNINKRIERHAALLDAITSDADLSKADSPLQLTPSERAEALGTLSGNLYGQNARLRQYVMLRLDSLLADGDASYAYPVISIEHVLPQQPPADSEWVKWFPTPQLREQWVHRLGNLVLLSRRKNSAASNYTFEKKKETYFRKGGVAGFALTTQVLTVKKWTPEIVAQRQQDLISRLQQLWRL